MSEFIIEAAVERAGNNSITIFLETEPYFGELHKDFWDTLPAGRVKDFLTQPRQVFASPADTSMAFYREMARAGLNVTLNGVTGAGSSSLYEYNIGFYWAVSSTPFQPDYSYPRLVIYNVDGPGGRCFCNVTISLAYSASE